jgi:hypothetical protein
MNTRAAGVAVLLAAARQLNRRTTSDIAAQYEARVHRLFMRACRAAAAAINPRRVEQALVQPSSQAALESALGASIVAFDEALREPLADLLMAVYLHGRKFAAQQLGVSEDVRTVERLAASIDPQADAVRWALERAALLVGYATEDMHEAIEALASELLAERLSIRDATDLIQRGAFVGLTGVGVSAVLTMFIAGATVVAAVKYAATLRSARGLLVGRTETITAVNAGQHALWMRAITARWVSPTTKRRWSAAPGACPRCAAIAGQVVGLTEPFRGPDGPILHPPAHPSCRCAVVME